VINDDKNSALKKQIIQFCNLSTLCEVFNNF